MFVISPEKTDIVRYFGACTGDAPICYAVQQNPDGSVRRALHRIAFRRPRRRDSGRTAGHQYVSRSTGLTFYPMDNSRSCYFRSRDPNCLTGSNRPRRRDRGNPGEESKTRVRVGMGAFKLTGQHFMQLHQLWLQRGRSDEYLGTLVNAYVAQGGKAIGIKRGDVYVDVGTLNGYREALRVLSRQGELHELAS